MTVSTEGPPFTYLHRRCIQSSLFLYFEEGHGCSTVSSRFPTSAHKPWPSSHPLVQCEREFHVGCLREHGVADLSSLPEGDWFCGGECARISGALQGLVERGPQALPQYCMVGGKPVGDGRERTWQLLRGRQGSKDNGKVLAAAVDILSVRHQRRMGN